MSEYKINKLDFMAKCVCEGGRLYAGFQYGLTPDDLDDSEPEFKYMVTEAYEHWKKFDEKAKLIYEKFGNFEDQAYND